MPEPTEADVSKTEEPLPSPQVRNSCTPAVLSLLCDAKDVSLRTRCYLS